MTGRATRCVNERVDTYLRTARADAADVTCAPRAAPKP
ncbi:hypothetical protein [Streptomyces sp. ADMS]